MLDLKNYLIVQLEVWLFLYFGDVTCFSVNMWEKFRNFSFFKNYQFIKGQVRFFNIGAKPNDSFALQHDIGFKQHPGFITKVDVPIEFQSQAVVFEKPTHFNYDIIKMKKDHIIYCDFTKIDYSKINISFVIATSSSRIHNMNSFFLYKRGNYSQYVTFHTQNFYSFKHLINFPEHPSFDYNKAISELIIITLNNPTTSVYNKSINQQQDINVVVDPIFVNKPRPTSI